MPAVRAEAEAMAVSSASASAMRVSWASDAPKATRSDAPVNRSTTAAVSSPRAVAWRDWDRRARTPVSHGTIVAARPKVTSRISPAAGSSHQVRATVAVPTTAAMANGGMTRSMRSWRASTSWTSRDRRSPRRKAGRPAGARRSRRW